jgi:ribosomal protein L40E
MGPFTFHIFGVFAILGLAWALFVLWIIGHVFRAVWIGFLHLTGMANRPPRLSNKARRCTHVRCLAVNPPQANFCRRCGSSLTRASAVRENSTSPDRWASWLGHS